MKYSKNIIKQKALLKKLIYKSADKIGLDYSEIPLKIMIQNKIKIGGFNSSYALSFSDVNTHEIKKQKIILSLIGLKARTKSGFSNSYYSNRHERLSFLIGQKKLMRQFIIFHELGHLHQKRLNPIAYNKSSQYDKEFFADNFALENLKKDLENE